METRIATSIEQSKKLIELGIDINTADMHYSTWTILNEGEYILSPNQGETIEELQEDYGNQVIPAWSLSALIQVLPITIVDSWTDYCLMLDIKAKMPRYVKYGDVYHPEFPWDFKKQSLLDNIVESIFWLHNNNYLNGSNRSNLFNL